MLLRKMLSLGVLLLSLTACKPDSPNPQLGNYQGTLIQGQATNGSSQPLTTSFAVAGILTESTTGRFHLQLHGFPDLEANIDFSPSLDPNNLNVQFSQGPFAGQTLAALRTCETMSDATLVGICLDGSALQLKATSPDHLNVVSLRLTFIGNSTTSLAIETPQDFTLDQAVHQAMEKEFNTRIEFQHMLQARLASKQALNNLLPSLNGGVLLGFANGPLAVLGVLAFAGNLAPFLLPSRWFLASETRHQSEAEADALLLMRGAAGLQVEAMAYALAHDQDFASVLNPFCDELSDLLPQIQQLETANKIPSGATRHFQSVTNELHDQLDDFAESIDIQKAGLAQALGLVNPQSVKSLSVPSFPIGVDTDTDLKIESLQGLALGRSLELRQMDSLIAAAQAGVQADSYTWLDPAADVAHSLGFGSGQTIAIDSSQVEQLLEQKNLLAATLLQNLSVAVVQFNHAQDDLADSRSNLKLETERWANLKSRLNAGLSIDTLELTSIPIDLIRSQLHLHDAQLEYRASRAHLDRLLLRGYYAALNPL